jgi:Na+-translocating ferredoxin:NAD+ oxidoreductase RnfG subunit
MEQMITMSINLHLFIIGATILLALYTIFASNSIKSENIYINRIKYIQPQYLSLVTAIAFTGITVMAVNHFVLKTSLILMVIAVLIVYFTSTKLHMIRKHANTKDIQEMNYLRGFVKKKYIGDVVLIVLVGIVSFFIS